ncbi:hypothetical protein H6P81_017220 [Aristolochia fimbriata]|uniref:Uncharacterized protein n=1 Tax=Aristolochia fimbriata TaxID=158543 RepID=A0AAV7DYW6_ARIFI|nr:hypothetical protein H6P81_017220 [Aristolochia fimbriata]
MEKCGGKGKAGPGEGKSGTGERKKGFRTRPGKRKEKKRSPFRRGFDFEPPYLGCTVGEILSNNGFQGGILKKESEDTWHLTLLRKTHVKIRELRKSHRREYFGLFVRQEFFLQRRKSGESGGQIGISDVLSAQSALFFRFSVLWRLENLGLFFSEHDRIAEAWVVSCSFKSILAPGYDGFSAEWTPWVVRRNGNEMSGSWGRVAEKMNLDSSGVTRCRKHPTQVVTGFCSSCLVERLANVDSVERSPKPRFGDHRKPADCSLVAPELRRDSSDIRVRRTLLSLFQLDDGLDSESSSGLCKAENSVTNHKVNELENELTNGGSVSAMNSTVTFSQDPDVPQGDRVDETESRHAAKESMETRDCGLDLNSSSIEAEKRASVENENSKYRNGSFWSGSTFSRKLLRWKLLSACTKHLMQDKHFHGDLNVKQSETNQNFRHSCDQKISCDSSKVHWEDPRHSWDGVMMGKTFAPTFMGIEEDPNSSIFYSRRSLPGDATMDDPRLSTDTKDMYKTSTTTSSEEKPMGEPNEESQCEEVRQDLPIPKIRRRNHGWSKVWNKNITSPLRDLMHKRENVLERSLSESWREPHKKKIVESIGAENSVKLPRCNTGSVRRQHSSVRSKNIGTGEMLRFKPDLQKKKKEFMFGRSQSVHYSSPGNLDSGLLRFYLTPLRSSRRGARRRTSRSFARESGLGELSYYRPNLEDLGRRSSADAPPK